jgi:hypothetical protein
MGQRAEDGGQKAEGRRQMAEVRRQRELNSEVGMWNAEI